MKSSCLFRLLLGLIVVISVKVRANEVKIIGGEEAIPHEFPFAVDILRDGEHYCSGSIYDKDWVITAAHCAMSNISSYTIMAGDHDTSSIDGREQIRTVRHIIIHPEYISKFLGQNDIALILTSTSFEFNTYIQPIPLRTSISPFATVIGWGQTSNVLEKVNVQLISSQTCGEAYGEDFRPNSMVCYGEPDGGKDACQGDSGGALVSGGQLVGVVSAGRGCGRKGYPTVYSDISYHNGFILEFARSIPESGAPGIITSICGGVLDGTSPVQISISTLGPNRSCIWTVKVLRSHVRLRALNGYFDGGMTLYVTEYIGGPSEEVLQITSLNEDYIQRGSMIFIILQSGSEGFNSPLVLEFIGTNYYSSIEEFTRFHFQAGSVGTISHPANGENYIDHESSLFVIQGNPPSTTLHFTRLEVLPSFDFIMIYEWQDNKFIFLTKLMGFTPPPPFISQSGVFLLVFTTDGLETRPGFTFNYFS